MRKVLSTLLILFGIFCYGLTYYGISERTNPKRVAFSTAVAPAQASTKEITALPAKIRIQSIDVSLPVIPAEITNGTWELTPEGVSYLQNSPIPGELGNSIMYGHNWPNLLGKLPQVKPGDSIEIEYADGTVRHFEVEYTVEVTPDDTHILDASKDRRITLYTCSGFMDWKRFVVVAILKK
jgi:LPXTG-site transpeptidase (sortase) family protein